MFEFRFLKDESNSDEQIDSTETANDEWFEAKEIYPSWELVNEIIDAESVECFKCGNNVNINHVSSNVANILSDKVKNTPVSEAEKDYSDLLTGVYEGGLKIWECTYDLINYITKQQVDVTNNNVLDLGCGAGIVGIFTFTSGSCVCFQDYNEEIVKHITIPNVYLNTNSSVPDNKTINRCRFYAGDWNSFLTVTEKDFCNEDSKFDYIFTCETIYNPHNYKKLHAVFKDRLKQNGVVYLAAKVHYFGVGGGLRQFEDCMKKENVFNFSTCWKCSEGLQREILKITFKKQSE